MCSVERMKYPLEELGHYFGFRINNVLCGSTDPERMFRISAAGSDPTTAFQSRATVLGSRSCFPQKTPVLLFVLSAFGQSCVTTIPSLLGKVQKHKWSIVTQSQTANGHKPWQLSPKPLLSASCSAASPRITRIDYVLCLSTVEPKGIYDMVPTLKRTC